MRWDTGDDEFAAMDKEFELLGRLSEFAKMDNVLEDFEKEMVKRLPDKKHIIREEIEKMKYKNKLCATSFEQVIGKTFGVFHGSFDDKMNAEKQAIIDKEADTLKRIVEKCESFHQKADIIEENAHHCANLRQEIEHYELLTEAYEKLEKRIDDILSTRTTS